MKALKNCFLFLAIIAITPSLKAQTADEIISKYIDAIGGKDKIASVKSVRMETSISANGAGATGSTVVVNGKGFRNESDWDGQKVIQVYTDKSGWTVNSFMGINEPQALADDVYKMGAYQIYVVPLLDYASRGGKVELVGKEKVGNIDAHKIKYTDANGISSTYFFDPTTGYMIKSVNTFDFAGQKTDLISTYSGYSKTDAGLAVAKSIDSDFGGQFQMTATVNKVEINGNIDPAIFEMKK
jgi:hypothetical protein